MTKVNKQQAATSPPKITWLLVELDSIQPDVMYIGVERTFSSQDFSMFPFGLQKAKMLG